MANADQPTMRIDSGETDRPSARRSGAVARRRVLLVVFVLVVAGIAVWANYGPAQAYQEAKARLEQASAAVSELQTYKNDLQGQLGKLSEAGYLESLARQQLAYLRPGEELYIVTGLGEATSPVDEIGLTEEAGSINGAVLGADNSAGNGAADSDDGDDDPADGAAADVAADSDAADTADSGTEDGPGWFERAVSGFLGLF